MPAYTITHPEAYLQFRDRQTYQPKQVDPGTVTKISWEYQEQGGLAQIAATLACPWETTTVLPGDYMEVWVLGETVPRARGIVSTPENRMDLKESRTLVAFGRMADMDKVLDYKVIFHPSGSSQDLSYYAAELLADYQQRKAVGGAFAPPLDIDFQLTGYAMESLGLTPGSVRSGFDTLYAQAGGSLVWGWDIHPITGNDRCFLRLRQYAVLTQFFIGNNVKLLIAPAELQPVTNAVQLKGGPAKYPNLLTNPSFEQPTNPSSDSGSLLQNGGFELSNPNHSASAGGETDCLGWNMNGSVTRNQHDPATNHNASPHTGEWYLLLDNTGKNATQEVAVTVGTAYLATAFVRAENASHLPVGALTITGRDAQGNITETPVGAVLTLAPTSVAWSGGAASSVVGSDALQTSVVFVSPATVKARITISYTSGNGGGYGLCVDDVTFDPVGAVGQYGWGTHYQNPGNPANNFNWIIWACKAAAWDGAYGVRTSVTANASNRPALAVAGNDNSGDSRFHFKPAGQQELQCGFFARMAPGLNTADGSLAAEYREWAGDGHETQFQSANLNGQVNNVPNDGRWHLVMVTIQAHGDASTATAQCTFGASGIYDIDGFFVIDAAHPVTQAQDPQSANYLRGADFERYVTAEAVCTSGSPADLAAAASYQTWGRREAPLSNEQIVDWTPDAQSYLQSWFQRNAILLQRPRLEITGEWNQVPTPCNGMQVAVNGTQADLPPQWCSHALFTFERSTLSIAADLSNERPTVAKMLKAAQASGDGGASSSVGAPSGGGQTGATTPAAQAVSSVNTQTGAVVLNAGNVGAEPALGNPAVSGYVLASTTAGVRSWVSAPAGTGGGGGATQVVTTPSPYWRMQSKLNALSRIPVAGDFSGLESVTQFANGPDGSLRYETPGLTLDAYWRMGLSNTTGTDIVVSWSLPYVDNFASGDFSGTSLFSISSSGPGGSGTFTVPAGTSGTLSLYYANTASQVYDTGNQGTFWFQMDALLNPGLIFLDADTGQSPATVIIGDATTAAPGLVEVHANAVSGQHPVVYLDTEVDTLINGVDTLIGTETTARTNADTALQNNISAEATTRGTADASEATARANADTTLQGNINTVQNNINTVQGNVTAEANARAAGDALAAQKSANLGDLASAPAARGNLGLVNVFGVSVLAGASQTTLSLAAGPLTVTLADASWVSAGQTLRADSAGSFAFFDVSAKAGNNVTLTWRSGEGGAGSGTAFAAGTVFRALRLYKAIWAYASPAAGGDPNPDTLPKMSGQAASFILLEYELGVDAQADLGTTATTIKLEAAPGAASFAASATTGVLTLAASSYQTVSPSPLAASDKMTGPLTSGMKYRPNTQAVGTGCKNLTVGVVLGF